MPIDKRGVVWFALAILVAGAIGAVAAIQWIDSRNAEITAVTDTPEEPPPPVFCDCYYDQDCGFLFYCRYDVECTWVPKGIDDDELDRHCPGTTEGSCDGLCKFLKLPYDVVGRDTVARVADLYFRAYMRAAEGKTEFREPDYSILAEARSIELPDDGHKMLTGAVFSTLDLTTGWDFAVGLRDMSDPERPAKDGFFRGIPEGGGMLQIIDAARRGFVDTIRSGEAEAIWPPLEEFWANNPNYRPNHGGRCYPHGHARYETAIECQRANLLKIAEALAAEDGE